MKSQYSFFNIFLIFLALVFFLAPIEKVEAGKEHNVFGYAWSSNIGWISFNNCKNPTDVSTCTGSNYGVSVDKSNLDVSGYAWSSNIGWISFNPNDWQACPPQASGCSIVNNSSVDFDNKWNNTGWARAVSVVGKSNTGGWDGWISFGGALYGASFDFNNLIDMDINGVSTDVYLPNKSAFWWGSDVVGWVDLNPVGVPPDSTKKGVFVVGSADPGSITLTGEIGDDSIVAGDNINLKIKTINGFSPTSCTGTNTSVDAVTKNTVTSTSNFSNVVANTRIGQGYSNIEVPHNTNNSNGVITEFKIECTDGNITATAVWNVKANQFNPELVFPYSCIAKTQKPTLDIINMKGDNPSCDVYGDNSLIGSTSGNTFEDLGFGGHDTVYNMQCTNGTSNQASHTSQNTTAKVCTSFYTISGSTQCGTGINKKYGAIFTKVPIGLNTYKYVAELELSANPMYGFEETPIAISSDGGSNIAFSPSASFIFSGGAYGKVKAIYTLSEADYIAKTSNQKDPIPITISFNPLPTPKVSLVVNFCPLGISTFIKPIYKPF